MIKLEYQSIKCFLQKVTLQIGLKKFLRLKKLKILYRAHMFLIILMVTRMNKSYENELQKANQKEFRIEKVIKRKGDKLYVKWKGYNNFFNCWIDKKDIV